MDCGPEIMFDAANIMRFGQHLLFNASSLNMKLGVQWLQRHLGEQYKIWECNITDNHIDSCILPLRPGLCLVTHPDICDQLPLELQGWDMILVEPIDREREVKNGLRLASTKIELNVFSVSQELIICHPEYERILNKKLKPYGITAIGSHMRHCELFSGAHHCTTLDVRRRGQLENYFL
jgi:glycine amidinotransferase